MTLWLDRLLWSHRALERGAFVAPLIEAAVERLQCMLEQHGVPQDEFPVKATVPLMLGVQAVVTFEKFSPSAVAGTHFDIPPEYVLQSEAG